MTETRATSLSELSRLGRYGIVGFLSTGAYALVYHAFLMAGLSPHLGYFIGFLASLATSFTLNNSYTFRQRSSHGKEMRRFLAVVLTSYTLCQALLYIFLEELRVGPVITFWLLLPVAPTLNYLGMRNWVFAAKR